ncbi:MAG: hypothetical protein HY017_33835 [Betaproteobacteria bacterium]|nr:hypothetical protein [Betaproteobacteria bacterium]
MSATDTLLVTGTTGVLGSAIAVDWLENRADLQLLFPLRADVIAYWRWTRCGRQPPGRTVRIRHRP